MLLDCGYCRIDLVGKPCGGRTAAFRMPAGRGFCLVHCLVEILKLAKTMTMMTTIRTTHSMFPSSARDAYLLN
jgi:hypothetical protein